MMASVLPDDPDADAIPRGSAWLDPEQPAYAALIYAGLRSAPEIYVNGLNAGHYVPSPWPTYTGIAVDKHYLWVFQPYGFACATHASVISCILSKRTAPRWIQYSLPVKMQGRFTTNVRGEPIGPD